MNKIKNKGFLVTFEGIDGSGKSTQINMLKRKLVSKGCNVISTREPGGSVEAECIRKFLFSHKYKWDSISELLLLLAARREHYINTILPNINKGNIIISDRFIDSTYAYQCEGKSISKELLDFITNKIIGDFAPNITFLMDIPTSKAYERITSRIINNKYDKFNLNYYNKVRKGYLKLAKINKNRIFIIDALEDKKVIAKNIVNILFNQIGHKTL